MTVSNIFSALGYTEKVILKKKRKTYIWQNFEVVLDDVEDLGVFVEFELQGEGGKEKFSKVFDLLNSSIGVTTFKQFDRGYVCMKVNPGYDFGKIVNL